MSSQGYVKQKFVGDGILLEDSVRIIIHIIAR